MHLARRVWHRLETVCALQKHWVNSEHQKHNFRTKNCPCKEYPPKGVGLGTNTNMRKKRVAPARNAGWGWVAWGVGWSLDWAFGLVLGHVDWVIWDFFEHWTWTLDWDLEKCW